MTYLPVAYWIDCLINSFNKWFLVQQSLLVNASIDIKLTISKSLGYNRAVVTFVDNKLFNAFCTVRSMQGDTAIV